MGITPVEKLVAAGFCLPSLYTIPGQESNQSVRREKHEAKVESVMKLKKDIEQNRANLKALANKRQHVEEKAKLAEVSAYLCAPVPIP